MGSYNQGIPKHQSRQEGYYQSKRDHQFEQYWEGNNYESEMAQSSSYQEMYHNYQHYPLVYEDFHRSNQGEYNEYSTKHSDFSQDYDQCQCYVSNQIQEKVANPEIESVQNSYESEEEEEKIARLNMILSEIDESLSLHYLTDQQRFSYLNLKCDVLSKRIEVRMQFSEVVETNTTPASSIVEELTIETVVVNDNELEEGVMDQP